MGILFISASPDRGGTITRDARGGAGARGTTTNGEKADADIADANIADADIADADIRTNGLGSERVLGWRADLRDEENSLVSQFVVVIRCSHSWL